MRQLLVLLALSFAFSAPADAQSPTPPASLPANQVQVSAQDVAMLLKAVRDAQTSSGITINVVPKESTEMPSYDAIAHFAGLDAKPASATIWLVKSPAKTETSAKALLAALELACMATGFAGPQWKGVYDKVAAMDATLPSGSPNPYANRLALTRQIQAIIDDHTTAP